MNILYRLLLTFSLILFFANHSICEGNYQKLLNGIQIRTSGKIIQVQFYSERIVRIQKWDESAKPDTSSLIVIQHPNELVSLEIHDESSVLTVRSASLTVTIAKTDGTIHFQNHDHLPLLKESEPATIQPITLKHESAFSIGQKFQLTGSEGIYGLGQHQNGYMNYRGRTVKLVQTNTDAVTPFLVSTMKYGILWDNYSKTIFQDDSSGASIWSEVASSIDYYVITGATIDSVISGYRFLTGQAPLYGKWAYGYWQSKEHYENRDELLHVTEEYRARKIPIDNIIQDWDYWDGNANWGQLYFDEKKYPRPKEMIDAIHRNHYHIMISVWPGLGPNTAIYKDMLKRGYLYSPVGWAGFRYYDAYNPKANDLFWQYADTGLFSKGIDAWWFDSTEPDVINALTKESTDYELKRMENNYLGSFARYLNPYSLLITEAAYRNQRSTTDQKRVYILTRSTFAGQQRAAATTWSGDIGADWPIYKHQISAGLNHCMAGIPYWTFDIGAFVIGSYGGVFSNGGKDPAYQELYTRMFQFGTFCPIFRSHGSETPREIWEFGTFTPTLIAFDRLRYRLLPYIYSLAHRVTDEGYTIMRGLPMDFDSDSRTFSIDDQFMFGPSMMVCPVTEYMLHKPPEQSVPVSSIHFRTMDNTPGLRAKYYKDTQYKQLGRESVDSTINVFWYSGRPDYVTDSTLSIRWEGKLIPTQTGKHQFHLKCFGPKRIYLDGKELPYRYQSVEVYTEFVELKAGKEYSFAVETENYSSGALRVQLYWKTPDLFAKEQTREQRTQTRSVYLPAHHQWYDFWTGKQTSGGTEITADAPIEKIPLLVPAGSLLPMGPDVQYSTEKPADPLEVRIYPGADGTFTLYEDENDTYNYEKGIFSTIPFSWNETKRQLHIGKRQGSFPGMLETRTFHILLVKENHGTGIETSTQPDRIIRYDGTEQNIQF